MGSSAGKVFDEIGSLGKDTAGFFTGGTSGVNVAEGKAPTEQTLATDASGLAAGPALAAGTAAAGGAAGAGAGGFDPISAEDVFTGQTNSALAAQQGVNLGNPALGTGLWANNMFGPGGPLGGGVRTGVQGAGAATEGGAPAAAPVTPAAPAAPAAPGAAPAAGGGTAPSVVGTQAQSAADHSGMIGNILKGMRENAGLASLGLSAAGMAAAGRQRQVPNEQQLNDLAATGSQAAKDLISSYRSGQVSAAQQAQLDQLTQQTKNQINNYFASIGQSDSTAHMQALAQVDQQAMAMKQQMLDNMLQQGLQSIGVAAGPLQTVANFQIQRDTNLTNAFGNFANAVGQAFGKQPTQTENPNKNITGSTPSSGAAAGSP